MWPWPIFRIFSFIKYQFFHNSFCQMRKVFMFLCIHSHLPRGHHHHQTTQFSFHPMVQSSSQFELLIAILMSPTFNLFSPNTVHFAFKAFQYKFVEIPLSLLLFILHITCFALERINVPKNFPSKITQKNKERTRPKPKTNTNSPIAFHFIIKKGRKNLVVCD
jgi:hypothetical protein